MHSIEGRFTEQEKQKEKQMLDKLKNIFSAFKKNTLPNIAKDTNIKIIDTKTELNKALKDLTLAIIISLILIFIVLYFRFSSIRQVLVIMLAIPFSYLGVLISLYIFNSTISLNSILGIILLNGICVANSILLVEMIVRLHEEGSSIKDAIKTTAKRRIRPILMTSLTTVLGMMPIAIGYGEGGKVLQPLGVAVCGGLWISLIFTLYIVPLCMYMLYNKKNSILQPL